MGRRKINPERLMPDGPTALAAMRAAAPSFYACPNGHALPNRQGNGRCTPFGCVGKGEPPGETSHPSNNNFASVAVAERRMLPRGLENVAMKREVAGPAEAEAVAAQSEEALAISRMLGARAAWDILAPSPDVPPPPDLAKLGPRAFVRQRLEDLSPLALHVKESVLRFGSMHRAAEVADEWLDRAGHPRRQEAAPDFRSPVVVLANVNVNMTPWDAQGKPERGSVNATITDREVPRAVGGSEAAGADEDGLAGIGVDPGKS